MPSVQGSEVRRRISTLAPRSLIFAIKECGHLTNDLREDCDHCKRHLAFKDATSESSASAVPSAVSCDAEKLALLEELKESIQRMERESARPRSLAHRRGIRIQDTPHSSPRGKKSQRLPMHCA